jgi:hypothetical protein
LPLTPALALLAAALPAGTAEASPSEACKISVVATVDHETFRQAGHDSSLVRLSLLRDLTRDRFTAAARRLCASGALRPADLASFRKLLVRNGEGATEPILYQEEEMGWSEFTFQYAFQDGAPPRPAEFEQALRCWKRPLSCNSGD